MKNFLKYFLAIALFQIIVYKTYTGDIPGYNEYKYTQWDSSCSLSDHEEHIDRMSRGQKYIGAVTGAPGYSEYKYTHLDNSKITSSE